ncbi:MAG: NADH-quinone oxidoreductase subunit M [Candidatus Coatesbacteria bacterium]|nr:MAG: NADH-quinone oxidoreductase subunit M [Candidatus Coatesbacteria bacterium]RLC43808.1 MAG: NADH-quinone oxidoreductase subunit M [Candidatus Coatesbacteria bacterium]RLC44997.1 MAG: NADH-quinone oxidoreductase subunit M [Candidatus Coatesbacteria bacterium]
MNIPHLLSIIVFTPVVGIIVLLFVDGKKHKFIRWFSAIITLIVLILSFFVFKQFNFSESGVQLVEKGMWIPQFNIKYFLGVDGLSLPLFFLTALLSFLACVGSFGIKERVKEYFILYLLLVTGMLGVFVALDMVIFYIFWEVVLVPMYFLIGIWGGPKREYAAIKFFLYTLFGSVVMLLGILALYFTSNPHTFDMMEIIAQRATFTRNFQIIVWLAMFIGFAIKVPIFPFHTWLPDAHVEAPTPISVLLAGILLKMGGYGFLRLSFPMLPEASKYFATFFAILGFINIVYGALVAMAQKDLKKLIAYSSVSHMGYVLLGFASMTQMGYIGGVLQMFNHGIITGALFLLVGVIYDRAHTRDIYAFGGLGKTMPVYFGIMTFSCFASLGLPGLAGFVSEFLCLIGAFSVFKVIVIASASGMIITAAYFLWTLQRMFMGSENERWKDLPDMSGRELFTLIPLMILMLLIGVYPKIIVQVMKPTLNYLVGLMY